MKARDTWDNKGLGLQEFLAYIRALEYFLRSGVHSLNIINVKTRVLFWWMYFTLGLAQFL